MAHSELEIIDIVKPIFFSVEYSLLYKSINTSRKTFIYKFLAASSMSGKLILLLYLHVLNCVSAGAQNPLGLRAASNLRGILFGTAIRVGNLRQNIDNGHYIDEIKNNYELVVPEGELKPRSIWQGENVYNWNNSDYLLGGPNSTGWVQQSLMKIRGHNLLWAYDKWIPD